MYPRSTHISTSDEPEFIGNIANLRLTVGKEAVMKCSVKNLGLHKVSWIHVDTQTVLTINEHVIERHSAIEIKHDKNEHWYLIVKNVSLDDKGYYTCQISTKPPKFQIGYLEVVVFIELKSLSKITVPPQFDDSSLKSGTNVTVREHRNVTLSCKANGNPKPEIKWTREDSRPILFPSNNEVSEIMSEELNFYGVSRWATGAYLCSASNGVLPSITRRIMLVVHFPPMIRIPAKVVSTHYGQNVSLVCTTESNPMAEHHWIDPFGNTIDDSAPHKYIVKTEKTYYFKIAFKLIIFQIDYSDSGNYACLVSNTFGEAKGAITLQ
ncbi:lachesin-like isoform X6, partial [Leptotrombidium deliense]